MALATWEVTPLSDASLIVARKTCAKFSRPFEAFWLFCRGSRIDALCRKPSSIALEDAHASVSGVGKDLDEEEKRGVELISNAARLSKLDLYVESCN